MLQCIALTIVIGLAAADEISIELVDGRLRVADVLEAVSGAAGMDPGDRFETLDWSIDVATTLGRLRLDVLDRALGGGVDIEVAPDRVTIHVDRAALAERGERTVQRIEGWIAGAVGADEPRVFGMTLVTLDDPRAPLDGQAALPRRVVVLVHGLDDPGWMWRDVAPRLLGTGHTVLRFEYPNDQPVADSTDLLAIHLRELKARGVERADLVAHSMGGLIARDVLTRKAYYDGDGTGGGEFPAVDALIMLGTPNHGSPLARLRGAAELHEHVSRWIAGDGKWLDWLEDGAGEAARDLLPGSDFLRRLNARPHPAATRYTIVAGRASPVSSREVEAMAQRLGRIAGDSEGARSRRIGRILRSMVDGLGDGVVSLESARLAGVQDTVVVEANHLGMIVNVLPSDDVPPAVGVILERLE